jgi:hypothetical protein
MDFTELSEQLSSVAAEIRPDKELEKLNSNSGLYHLISNRSVDNSTGLADKIAVVLSNIRELRPLSDGSIRDSPSSSSSVNLLRVSNWLLAQTRFRPASEVVGQLKAFLSENSAPMSEIFALWGLNPKSPIKLTNDVTLVHIDSLVPSLPKDQMTGIRQRIEGPFDTLFRLQCTAALKRDFLHTPIMLKEALTPDKRAAMQEATAKMEQVAKCLCLISETSVCKLAQWYESPQRTPIIQSVGGWGGQEIEHIFQFAADPVDYDEPLAQSIVQRFLGLTDGERQKLDIPLSRLNTALRSSDAGDTALDLGIAIEALLGASDTDISYKVRQRATYLLSGTPGEKRKTFDYLKMLYALRSKVAHGTIPNPTVRIEGREIPTMKFLKESCALCVKLIRKVLASGFVQDWDAAILGMSSRSS